VLAQIADMIEDAGPQIGASGRDFGEWVSAMIAAVMSLTADSAIS
jgi:hypothetical protein